MKSLSLLLLLAAPLPGITAREAIERIKAQVGVPWRADTVDTIKAGDPDTPVTGIATTMVATYDVLVRAAAEGKNLVITHEPVFYSHLDKTDALDQEKDPVWAEKERFIKEHHMVVFRFHDHWHAHRPDGILTGVVRALQWRKFQDEASPVRFTVPETTVAKLAAQMRERLGIQAVRVVGDPEMKVMHVALSPGAGGPLGHRKLLRQEGVEALAIGEVPEWETIEYVNDAAAQGKKKALILLGHIPSEQPGMEDCADWLRTFIPEVPVKFIAARELYWTVR